MNTNHPISTSREVLSIVLLAVAIGLVYNAFAPKGLPLIAKEPMKEAVPDSILFPQSVPESSKQLQSVNDTSAWKDIKVIAPLHERALHNPDSMKAVVSAQKEVSVYKIISRVQLQRLLAEHRSILIDARNAEDYRKGRIRGAHNIPGIEVDQHFEELVELPRDTLVLIYCNNPDCHLGRSVAEFMNVMEFKNLLLYDDGWDGWLKANMPIDTTLSTH